MNIFSIPLKTLGFLLLGAVVAQSAAAADSPSVQTDPGAEQGVVNAASLRPLPKGSAFSVRPWDNSEENEQLAVHIAEQLRARGFTAAAEAPLVLKFSGTDVLGEWSSGPSRRLVEIDGKAGTGTDDEARVRLNLFSTDKGGVFNEGRPHEKVLSTYSLEMTVDRQDGRRLWQGEATAKLAALDRRQLARLMVPVLLDNMGKTVRSRPFGVK